MNKEKVFPSDNIFSYFISEWKILLFITLTGLIYNIGLLAGPWFEGQMAQCLVDIIKGSKTISAMITLAISYIITILIIQTARFFKRFYVRRFANNINRRMKSVLYGNLVRENRLSLVQQGSGELITKAISDVDDCSEGMRKFTTELFDTGIALISYISMLFGYDWRLALICILFVSLSYVGAQCLKKKVQKSSFEYKKSSSELNSFSLDRVKNAFTYRIYGCERYREIQYEEVLNKYEHAAVKANIWQSSLPPLYLVLSNTAVIFILYFGAKNVLSTGWTSWDIATFTTFLSCFIKMSTKSSKAAKKFNAVQRAEVSWKRIKPLMKNNEKIKKHDEITFKNLSISDLSFSYDNKTDVFKNLSLTANRGDIIGITGSVACGKSTLGKIFLYEYPYRGSIIINDKELSTYSPDEIAATIGYLGHDPELLNDTIKENILCGSKEEPEKYLKMVQFFTEVNQMEKGMDTIVGSGGIKLSGGQQQRLALARTLAHSKPVMVLDDPFSALDRNTEDAIFEELKEFGKDKVVFLISHRLYHFPKMQKIIFMENGNLFVETHEELLKTQPSYKKLYMDQTGGNSNEK